MQKKRTIDWIFVILDDLIGGGTQQVLYRIINYFIEQGKFCTVVFTVRKKHIKLVIDDLIICQTDLMK